MYSENEQRYKEHVEKKLTWFHIRTNYGNVTDDEKVVFINNFLQRNLCTTLGLDDGNIASKIIMKDVKHLDVQNKIKDIEILNILKNNSSIKSISCNIQFNKSQICIHFMDYLYNLDYYIINDIEDYIDNLYEYVEPETYKILIKPYTDTTTKFIAKNNLKFLKGIEFKKLRKLTIFDTHIDFSCFGNIELDEVKIVCCESKASQKLKTLKVRTKKLLLQTNTDISNIFNKNFIKNIDYIEIRVSRIDLESIEGNNFSKASIQSDTTNKRILFLAKCERLLELESLLFPYEDLKLYIYNYSIIKATNVNGCPCKFALRNINLPRFHFKEFEQYDCNFKYYNNFVNKTSYFF